MFYIIAAVLIVAALFFLYSANSAFVELRQKSKGKIDVTLDSIDPYEAAHESKNKHVDAKPYMVVLFLTVALILLGISYASVSYQPTWEQNWNEFWHITPKADEPMLNEQTKSTIYNIAQKIEIVTMYMAIASSVLFVLSLPLFKRASVHLFVSSIGLAFVTFLCFIMSLYTEPDQPKVELEVAEIHVNNEAMEIYFKDSNTDVIKLSQFIRDYFKIPRDLDDANVDQLRQYAKGLNEIKQNLSRVEVPKGAESAAKLSTDWINQEIYLTNESYAAKGKNDFLNIVIRFVSEVKNLYTKREEQHHNMTNKLQQMRSKFSKNQQNKKEDLKSHFNFIK